MAALPDAAYVYMVRCTGGQLYTGWTNHPAARLKAHQSGKGARYTRAHGAVGFAYLERCADRSAALRREAALKKLSKAEKEVLCAAWRAAAARGPAAAAVVAARRPARDARARGRAGATRRPKRRRTRPLRTRRARSVRKTSCAILVPPFFDISTPPSHRFGRFEARSAPMRVITVTSNWSNAIWRLGVP